MSISVLRFPTVALMPLAALLTLPGCTRHAPISTPDVAVDGLQVRSIVVQPLAPIHSPEILAVVSEAGLAVQRSFHPRMLPRAKRRIEELYRAQRVPISEVRITSTPRGSGVEVLIEVR